jgi:cellobiose phosphorylase
VPAAHGFTPRHRKKNLPLDVHQKKAGPVIIHDSLHRFKLRLLDRDFKQKYPAGEPPLHSELFSMEQMEQYGKILAGMHTLGTKAKPVQPLLSRLADNEAILLEVHDLVSEAVKANNQITPAGEWLLDNFYLIEEQIRTGRKHFPKGYSKELPRLQNGPSAGLPRVYDIAKEIISHGEGHVNPDSLRRLVASYQTITPLKLGELWAIPIMLRLALIENLRSVATRIASGRIDRDLADSWADQMIDVAEKDPKSLILVIADMARSDPPMSAPFVSEFARRLQGQSPALAFPLTWIEQRLSESNQTILQMIQYGNQQQAADQVSVSNSIGSLRFLSSMDWRDFVEAMSHADHVLQNDPMGSYRLMDFKTRDNYRHLIEKIAKESRLSEIDVAQKAIELAQNGAERNGRDHRTSHVGFYLVGKGLRQLEKETRRRVSPAAGLRKAILRFPLFFYLGTSLSGTLVISAALLFKAYADGVATWSLWFLGVLAVFCSSSLSIALVNWLATLFVRPSPLPRLDYSKGIPPESRTLVIVPSMLNDRQNIEELIEALEVRFLANRDSCLHFGLLTDLKDAPQEKTDEDRFLENLASEGICGLNRKYPGTDGDAFFLFHRPRVWNPGDRIWMGHERKRGKLSDLNSQLRGGSASSFSLIIGDTGILEKIKYVITLDSDTQLPRDSAWQMIGVMAHPLNKPEYDSRKGRVTEGYTILQPRVAVSLPGTNRSRYARLFGSEPGIDPYTRAISDVYQDLFGEGSFIGKGIYEVDSFERTLRNRLPENRVLSHDLLEGCYTRSGLISDVLLFEEYPASYKTDVKRRSRWIRGDWQLTPWLWPVLSGLKGPARKNPLSLLSVWKIIDNLRRSIVPAALTALLLTGWFLLPSSWFWTLVVLGMVSIPPVMISAFSMIRKPEDVRFRQHWQALCKSAAAQWNQTAFVLMSLPYEAFYSLSAILRACWRVIVTKKHLLEWDSGSHGKQHDLFTLAGSFLSFWISPLAAVLAAAGLFYFDPENALLAAPVLGLWFLFPVSAWWLSRALPVHKARLTDRQYRFLSNLSRRTWGFYETFMGPGDNWLPPDNYQEQPVAVIAHRTSPTNIGLALLANLSAYDFGYIQIGELLQRTSDTFNAMSSLERYQGHFYNWYDTRSLEPLRPHYVSTVDSGNLAGHLLTLKQGLSTLANHKITGPRIFEGINDTLQLLLESAGEAIPVPVNQFNECLQVIQENKPAALGLIRDAFESLAAYSAGIMRSIRAEEENSTVWALRLSRQCQWALDDLRALVPWVFVPELRLILEKYPGLDAVPTLQELIDSDAIGLISADPVFPAGIKNKFRNLFREGISHAKKRVKQIKALSQQSTRFADMEYGFLYDEAQHLMVVGYDVDERRRDSGYYDLLASEARLSSFVAISQDQIPQESWFALGRLLTTMAGEPILLSWSGSMFEYLMPLLVMPVYENTLLHQTCRAAVLRQIEYGKLRGVPWGISESGYNAVDVQKNYQYRAFGVPGLGLKRGLSEDLVIAPYATALALMVSADEACRNLERMAGEGFMGKYGFYEAIDYTAIRVPRGQTRTIVKSFMSHHIGMSFLSLASALLDGPMQKRFESDPLFKATLLLLQERIPRETVSFVHTSGGNNLRPLAKSGESSVRMYQTADTACPEVNLLSNGNRFRVMVTNAGGGYIHWKDLAVTRWREDPTCDNWGPFCYIRDADSGNFWSATYQPTLKQPERYEAVFTEGRAEFHRRDDEIDTHTEIVVSPEDDMELRRIKMTNRTRTRRIIEITSYAEVVMASNGADLAHPAFSNLFVQTEIIPTRQAILCSRRPRSESEQSPWMLHLMAVHGAEVLKISYETDRMKFIGRGNTLVSPQAVTGTEGLTGSQGSVLDPVVAIQYRIVLEAEGSATIDIVTGVSETRDDALILVDKYRDKHFANRVFELAWTHNQVVLRQINAGEPDAQCYCRLASSIIYSNSSLRAESSTLLKNRRGQSGLWGYSISGDLPIVLLQIEDPAQINLVRQIVQAHAYWRIKGLAVDLVIWNEDHAGYRQLLQEQILGLIAAGVEANIIDRPGGIFLRLADQISSEDRILFQTAARVIISDARGELADQISRRGFGELAIPVLKPTRSHKPAAETDNKDPGRDLAFFNGTGGFTPDGREYLIVTAGNKATPAPWVNVLANPQFGTVISENGRAYTWAVNSHEYRLTPWNNDPVTDLNGEALYLRDEETGHFWSPAPLTDSGSKNYLTRHGFGYSVFEHDEGGIKTELWVYVALDAAVKFTVLKVRNESGRNCKLSATSFAEWVLGDMKHKTIMHVNTKADLIGSSLFATNPYNSEFADRVAFLQTDDPIQSCTCDRTEFLGRNGTLKKPAALFRTKLSGKKGAGLDPCAAIQVVFDLSAGQDREIVFRLGSGQNQEDANNLIRRFRGSGAARAALEAVWQYWNHTLGAVQIETPDLSVNIMANGWLLYQTMACRMWARSGFYQSGGAFGFRDQLQDAMALVHTEPRLLREQILLFAGRQFEEGDVQHWWHPPTGRGVRTHCSDDYLWLPLAASRYVKSSGDTGILDETEYYLKGRPVKPEDDSHYDLPGRSNKKVTLYDHCRQSLIQGLKFGIHGLPLMGTCDWNDGMNMVGNQGKGESVWLAFFLYEVLMRFNEITVIRGDEELGEYCRTEADKIRRNIEANAWDGEWYRRAWFDNGTPLGSAANDECQIDSISQSWSVLSGAGDPDRSRIAMESVNKRLVRRKDSLIQLLDPPFDKSDLNPGYIKGYVPGVRENGGQYTHAAIWTAMAFAKTGDNKKAWEILGMINPINHAATERAVEQYKVEPYVMAADVYALDPHVGRGCQHRNYIS